MRGKLQPFFSIIHPFIFPSFSLFSFISTKTKAGKIKFKFEIIDKSALRTNKKQNQVWKQKEK